MKSLITYTPINMQICLVDSKGIIRKGTISMDSTFNAKGQFFIQAKASGYRFMTKWIMIQSFPSIKTSENINNSGEELTVNVSLYQLTNILIFLKGSTLFYYEQLRDISAIDHVKSDLRFEVIYQLLSITNCNRLSITAFVSEGASLVSATDIYPSAGWYERETWDRFGIFFFNHPDLRRILTDYGFKGHPLRKDFPVSGFVEVRYNADTKSIAYEKVSLAQASRETISSLY